MEDRPPPSTWREFFDAHAPHYMRNPFTRWTKTEVSFLLERMKLAPGAWVLDLGCGTGRHAIEFARRGFRVTGVDVSPEMVREARRAAEEAGVRVNFVVADATLWRPDRGYDACVCLCEGGFGLVNLDEEPVGHDLAILKTAHLALRPGAPFVLTALNGYSIIRRMRDEDVESGVFDPATMVALYQDRWSLPEGERIMTIKERLFIPPELVAMLRYVGFEVEHVWGGTAGEWGERPLKLDEVEAMYWCRKRQPEDPSG